MYRKDKGFCMCPHEHILNGTECIKCLFGISNLGECNIPIRQYAIHCIMILGLIGILAFALTNDD